MKKGFVILIALFSFFCVQAQEKVKDTVKTEIVNVVTTYNPKIADASKIKKNPKIKLLEKSGKKKLAYTIFSAPVASTFIPKSGTVKGIDLGIRERIYRNYIAAGFGNYTSPYFEAFLYHNTNFSNEFGLSVKYSASEENIENTILNSNFSNFEAGIFYKQEERYFDWKLSLNSEFNKYNWYGLPALNFNEATINAIEEEQAYNYFQLVGDLDFIDSNLDFGKVSLSYFSDSFKSNEALIKLNTSLDLPLDFIQRNLNDLQINAGLEFLTGEFKNNYIDENQINYSFFTTTLNPEYKISTPSFTLNAGAKLVVSVDSENSATNFFVFPEVLINVSAIQNYLNLYGGITGDLKTNTYKDFTEENPYVSPTLLMNQTVEKTNFFVGLNGKISNGFSFNLKINAKNEEDKPLFVRNNSKSNGTNQIANSISLKGYEYGNSFGVIYDDVKTTTIFGELEYDLSKTITLGANIQQNSYTTTNALESYNLPSLQASIFGKYNNNKWFLTTNIFYVGDREDAIYSAIFPSTIIDSTTIDSFIDVNLNGGYHFNDKFSAFLKLNNILNSEYQRFENFNTQGFQVLGGITYKFDF